MLRLHESVPHFRVRTVDGRAIDYRADVWQRQNLILVCLPAPADAAARDFVSQLAGEGGRLSELNACLVSTIEAIPGVPNPGVVLADRWGEIFLVVEIADPSRWPAVDDVVATVGWMEMKCPECEGEAK
jgi:hypothetical protein